MTSDVIKGLTSSFHRRRPESERRGEERLTDVVVTEALLEQVSDGERGKESLVEGERKALLEQVSEGERGEESRVAHMWAITGKRKGKGERKGVWPTCGL